MGPRVVIVGAGIVGTSLADELTVRGACDVTVVDRGPLFATGGSTSHAPGLVFQTNASKTMSAFAAYTTGKFATLHHRDGRVYNRVGGLEIAASAERLAELDRKAGWAQAWGISGRLVDPAECAALHPLVDPRGVLGGFYTPTDGLAAAVRAAQAQADRAIARGAVFVAQTEVFGVVDRGGRVGGVETSRGVIDADIVVLAAGFWGAQLARGVDLALPLVAMAHQYAKTGQLAALVGRNDEDAATAVPILRHQDRDLYFRQHLDRLGIGSYGHDPMPVEMATLVADTVDEPMPSMLPFTDDDFEPAWRESVRLLPALADAKVEEGFNGVFSFTADGLPLLGEHRDLGGLWVAEAVWVTHSAGVARAVAQWVVDGAPGVDVAECDLYRFEEFARSPRFVDEACARAFVEVYDVIHPRQPRGVSRGIRTSPFHRPQLELGAVCGQRGGWEWPAWFETNAGLLSRLADRGVVVPERDDWAGRFWSPISIAEAAWTRDHVAVYDLTPLPRYELAGARAAEFLQQLTTNDVEMKIGSACRTLMLDVAGGIRGDLLVARLSARRFHLGANGPRDLDWLTRHLPADGTVALRDLTGGTCAIGVWGPAARDVVQPLCRDELSARAFPASHALQTYLGAVPVTMLSTPRTGAAGWEVITESGYGAALWELLAAAGDGHEAIAAGSIALECLRMEVGGLAWGTDMTAEHRPEAAGLESAVCMSKGDFVGKAALHAPRPRNLLWSIAFDDPAAVVLGGEPVFVDDACVGFVTGGEYSPMRGRTIAHAWLPDRVAAGDAVGVDYRGSRHAAVVDRRPGSPAPPARTPRGGPR